MESPAAANLCAKNQLSLESVLSGGALEIGTLRVCEVNNCAGAAVLRQGLLNENSRVPEFANADGTPHEDGDNCPVYATAHREVDARHNALLRAIRKPQDPNA
jgi:hypothetical protein